jgi:hypothetical protein
VSRLISPSIATAIASRVVTLALFAEIAFADDTLYLWSGIGSVAPSGPSWSSKSTFPYGQSFTGTGWLGRLSTVPGTKKVQAQNITLGLNGIPSSLVLEALNQVRMTGTVTIWLAFLSGGSVIPDPLQIFSGSLDVPSLTDSGETSLISITCENSLLSLNLAPNRVFSDADQQIYFPGDLGFSFTDKLSNIALFWPAPLNVGNPYPVFMTVTPSPPSGPSVVDLAVGATTTLYAVITYSDGSTYTMPSGTGGGPAFILGMGSTNPRVAAFNYVATNNVIGVAEGECQIIARVPVSFSGGNGPAQMYRAACNVLVHS